LSPLQGKMEGGGLFALVGTVEERDDYERESLWGLLDLLGKTTANIINHQKNELYGTLRLGNGKLNGVLLQFIFMMNLLVKI